MKHLFLISFLSVILCCCVSAQSVQYGYTEEYNGVKAKRPLSRVAINAGGATAVSGKDGRFRLEFRTLKVGDRVAVDVNTVVSLKGYVLFNQEALEQWTVSAASNYFRIVLCPKKMFDRLVMTYYNVSDKSCREQLQREREKVQRLKEQGEIEHHEYERRLQEADDRYRNAVRHLMENAELVARIDESELEGDQVEILRLAKEGRLDEAIRLIRQSNTLELFAQAVTKNEYAISQKEYYEHIEAEARDEMRHLAAILKNDIKILQLAGGKENYDLCAEYWERIIAADTTDKNNLWNGARFFRQQNMTERAERYYLMILHATEELAQTDSIRYAPALGNTLNNLALLYTDIGQTRKAVRYHDKALDVRYQLLRRHPRSLKYGVDFIQSMAGLGNAYFAMNQYDKAEDKFKAVLSLDSILLRIDTVRIRPLMAGNLHNLSVIFLGWRRYDESEKYGIDALGIYTGLAAADPEYKDLFAMSLNHLSLLYRELDMYAKAEEYALRSLEVRQEIAKHNPGRYNADYAQSLNNIGVLYSDYEQYGKAERYLRQALAIRKNLAEENPALFGGDLSQTLTNLCHLYANNGNTDAAYEYSRQSLVLLRKLSQNNPAIYNPDLAVSLTNYSILLCANNHAVEAEEYLMEMVGLYQSLVLNDSARFMPDYAQALNLVTTYYLNLQRLDEATDYFGRFLTACLQIGEVDGGILTKKRILEDIQRYEDAGIIPEDRYADISRLREMLSGE